jgi:Glutaminase
MKIWAFAPSLYSNTDPTMIRVKDKNGISLTDTIDWRYHVALVVLVKTTSGLVEEYVIDLALFPKRPVYYRTWLFKFKTDKLIHLFTDDDWYLFNTWYSYTDINATVAGEAQEFKEEPSVKLPKWFPKEVIYDFYRYENDCLNNHWLEKGLAVNATAYQFFMDEIYPKMNNNFYQSVRQDYQLLVGDVYNFETVFRDFTENEEITSTFLDKHSVIIAKYREIYSLQLAYWKKRTNLLNLKPS